MIGSTVVSKSQVYYDHKGEIIPRFSLDYILKGDTFNVIIPNYPMYINIENPIIIEGTKNLDKIKIITSNGDFYEKKKSKTKIEFAFIPKNRDNNTLKIEYNDTSRVLPYNVSDLPDPRIFFESKNSSVLSKENIKDAILKAECIGIPCKILGYELMTEEKIDKNRVGVRTISCYSGDCLCSNSKMSLDYVKFLDDITPGKDFYVSDLRVELPDGTIRLLKKKFKLVRSKLYVKIMEGRDLETFSESYKPNKLKTDLRIKLDFQIEKSLKDTLEKFIAEDRKSVV